MLMFSYIRSNNRKLQYHSTISNNNQTIVYLFSSSLSSYSNYCKYYITFMEITGPGIQILEYRSWNTGPKKSRQKKRYIKEGTEQQGRNRNKRKNTNIHYNIEQQDNRTAEQQNIRKKVLKNRNKTEIHTYNII